MKKIIFFLFQKKKCKGFCPLCEYYEQCRAETLNEWGEDKKEIQKNTARKDNEK